MIITGKLYDTLKYIALIGLPSILTFYLTLAAVWDWANSDKVALTIGAIQVLLGGLLRLSSKNYDKSDKSHEGFLEQSGVDPDTGRPNLQMTLTALPEDLLKTKTVRLKVR